VRKGGYEAFCRPDTVIPLMYMPDALRAVAELAEAPAGRLRHRMYNIAAMSPRAEEIAACVAKRLPGAKFTFKPDPMKQGILDSWPRRLDDAEARKDWGWKAKFDLDGMTDDLLAKVREMSGGAPAAAPATAAKPTRRPPAAAKRR
jgi:threonine 3-dehydrogenase